MLDLVHDHPIRVAEDLEALRRHLSEAADRQARPREGLAVDHLLGHPQLDPDRAHLVFEEVAKRLDELKAKAWGQAADVVVGLDLHRGRGDVRCGGLDDIGIQRPLRKEVDVPELRRLGFENGDELATDDAPLLLRVGDPAQRVEEPGCGIDIANVHVEVAVHHRQHALGFLFAQKAVVDEHARELVANRAMDERRGHCGIDST